MALRPMAAAIISFSLSQPLFPVAPLSGLQQIFRPPHTCVPDNARVLVFHHVLKCSPQRFVWLPLRSVMPFSLFSLFQKLKHPLESHTACQSMAVKESLKGLRGRGSGPPERQSTIYVVTAVTGVFDGIEYEPRVSSLRLRLSGGSTTHDSSP